VHVYLQPRASRDRLMGLYNSSLKIALTAPPIDNAANIALISFLAVLLRVPPSSITIRSGAKSREKCVQISSVQPQILAQQLEQLLLRVDKKIRDG